MLEVSTITRDLFAKVQFPPSPHTSGGKLELTKCAWYCISWKLNPNGIPSMSNNTSYKIVLLDSANQQLHTIKQLPINSPFKYLGTESTPL